jgi:hypothetical protein
MPGGWAGLRPTTTRARNGQAWNPRPAAARAMLTHPRALYEIEATALNMHLRAVAGSWLHSEFDRLFKARIHATGDALSGPDRAAFPKNLVSAMCDRHPILRRQPWATDSEAAFPSKAAERSIF